MMSWRLLVLFLFIPLLAACGESIDTPPLAMMPVPAAPERKPDSTQLAVGEKVYRENCARCHGDNAEGDANWRKRDAQSNFPPPPLNGSGHAWHHPTLMLKSVIQDGSPDGKGNMPPWRGKLSEPEIDAVVLWFQSLWPQPVYDAWFEMQQRGQ